MNFLFSKLAGQFTVMIDRRFDFKNLEMRIIKMNKNNIFLTFVGMFLMTSIILVIMEISFPSWYRKYAQKYNVEYFPRIEVNKNSMKKRNVTSDGKNLPLDGIWQKVSGSRFKFFVYSAFLDDRSDRQWIVRIIGATRTKTKEKVVCAFYYSSGDEELINGKIVPISENWNLPYSAAFIICNIRNKTSIPNSVSVFARNKGISTYKQASNHLLINNHNIDTLNSSGVENEDKIAICIKPLHFFDKTLQLMEFLELNMLLGASHFTFYKASLGVNTNCILENYIKQNVASAYPWRLGILSKTEIRTEGMFAALNDCLYRNMHKYSFVAFLDVDEFIVPRSNMTILDLIKGLNVRFNTKNISSFSFQNAFFYLQWPDDNVTLENEVEKNLITLRKTRRTVRLNAHKQRSKFIVKPRNVVEVGNHFVWQFFYNHNTLNVPSSIAMLNHYRVCEFDGDDCVHLPSTVDRTLYRYRKPLTHNVARQLSTLQSKCNVPIIINSSDSNQEVYRAF